MAFGAPRKRKTQNFQAGSSLCPPLRIANYRLLMLAVFVVVLAYPRILTEARAHPAVVALGTWHTGMGIVHEE